MENRNQVSQNQNETPRFNLRVCEDGKIVLRFNRTDEWLHMVLWKAFKLHFLGSQNKYGPEDFDFLRSGIIKMLHVAKPHYQLNSENEFVLKAASTNLFELKDIMYKIVGEIHNSL